MHDLFHIIPGIIPRPRYQPVPGWYGKGHVLISIYHILTQDMLNPACYKFEMQQVISPGGVITW